MKKAKEGVALILTISVLSALSILGITFMMLLTRDQALMNEQVKSWNNDAAVNTAIRAGIEEIKKQTEIYSAYFGSTIQTAYESKRDSEPWNTIQTESEDKRIQKSSFLGRIWDFDNKGDDIPYKDDAKPGYIYFKNTIRASNAKLSLYQGGPEFRNLMLSLGTVLKDLNGTTKIDQQCRRIADTLLIYNTSWVLNDVDEILKMPICVDIKADAKERAEAIDLLKPYLTTTPIYKPDELSVNIIDYGVCDTASGTTFRAIDRDFLPINEDIYALKGAIITIIGGTGIGQSNVIDTVDNTDDHVLNLENNWTTTPDSTSKYRIHSLVSPINFNAADKELIEANLKIVSEYFNQKADDFSHTYRINSGTWLNNIAPSSFNKGDIRPFIQSIQVPSVAKDYLNFKEFRSDSLPATEKSLIPVSWSLTDHYNKNLLSKDYFLKLFMLNQPKGFDYNKDDADETLEIPSLPVPFVFEHNGYFDMEVVSSTKNNPNSKVPLNNIKRYSTVRLEGKKEISLREDFENSNAIVNWMTANDFVPFQSIIDFSDWYMENTSGSGTHYNTKEFHPYPWVDPNPTKSTESERFPNMLPDSIKTGLWLDFGGDGKFFDQDSSSWKDMNLLNSMFQTLKGTPITSTGQCQGNGTPESEYELAPNGDSANYYSFGDICTVIRLVDSAEKIYHSTDPNDYDFGSTGNDVYSHTKGQHKKIFPPEKYFTPTLVLWNENLGATFRQEKGYDTTAYPNESPSPTYSSGENPSSNCNITTSLHTFAVSADIIDSSTSLDVDVSNVEAYRANTNNVINSTTDNAWWSDVQFYSILANNPESTNDYIIRSVVTDQVNVDETNDDILPYTDTLMFYNDIATASGNTNSVSLIQQTPPALPIDNNSPFGNISSNNMRGHICIKRDWNTNYFDEIDAMGTKFNGAFDVDFLRIIPGPRDDSGTLVFPYYQTAPIELKKAKYIKKVRVWYETSQHSSFSSAFNGVFSFNFNLIVKRPLNTGAEWAQNPDITYDSDAGDYIIIGSQSMNSKEMSEYYTKNDHSGYQDIFINQDTLNQNIMIPDENDSNYDQDVEFKIEVCYKDQNIQDELLAYLRTTIAITRIELFYEAEPTIIRCSENP